MRRPIAERPEPGRGDEGAWVRPPNVRSNTADSQTSRAETRRGAAFGLFNSHLGLSMPVPYKVDQLRLAMDAQLAEHRLEVVSNRVFGHLETL